MAIQRVTGLAVLAVVVGLLSACGGGGQASDGVTSNEIVVGSTNAATGPAAGTCKPVTDGAEAWFKSVNADGGVGGRKIKATVLDDGYDAPKALANARKLARKPVFAIFGGCGSIQPPAVSTVTEREKIPYLFPVASVPEVTDDQQFRGLQPLYNDQYRGFTEAALKIHGPGSVFILNQQTPGLDQLIKGQKDGIAAAGGTVVGNEQYAAGLSDVAPFVLQIKKADPDYVILGSIAADGARIFQALKAANALPKKFVLSNSGFLGDTFLRPIGAAADGKVLTPASVAPATSPEASQCLDAFKQYAPKLTADPSSLAGCAYAQVFVEALKEAGDKPTRKSLLAAIDGWTDKEASPLLTPLTFAGGRHIGLTQMAILGVDGGKPVLTKDTFPLAR